MHAGAEYLVYFLGFAPGFAYLGGLPPELTTPRLTAPRKHVPAGSVAIGGNQTGVYPIASPGGWRIIGHTDAKLFDPGAPDPVLLRMGDQVRFVPEAA
jgi:KipI family sensor histidine kinase inhibitor